MLKKQKAAREEGLGATTQGCWVSFFAAPRREGWGCPGTPALTATTSEPQEETYALAWHRGSAAAHLQRITRFGNTGRGHLGKHQPLFPFGWAMSACVLRAGGDLTSCQVQLHTRSVSCPVAMSGMLCCGKSLSFGAASWMSGSSSSFQGHTERMEPHFTCQLSFLREQHSTPMD